MNQLLATLWNDLKAYNKKGIFFRHLNSLKYFETKCFYSANANVDSFLSGNSAVYIDEMYKAWQNDPKSVHISWQVYFKQISTGTDPIQAFVSPRKAAELNKHTLNQSYANSSQDAVNQDTIQRHLAVQNIITSHQIRGHHISKLDPLNILAADLDKTSPENLTLEYHKLSKSDLDRTFRLPDKTFISGERKEMQLREILERLKETYCNRIGVEYMFINNPAQIRWIREKFETPGVREISQDEKRMILRRLIRSTRFENFLARKWQSEKRFGLEGCEVLIPSMKAVIDRASDLDVDSFVIGMPHRGRLNVLANVCRKPLKNLFCQFNSDLSADDEGAGDVKYHLGVCNTVINNTNGRQIRLSVVANPSHLEAVDPVVEGKVYAEQFYRNDKEGDKVISILLHGDAAFSGQGVVYETFHLSELPHYSTRGTIHIVVNNQIGFTTDPRLSRSSPYCTDVARVVNAPIFHVNADHPEEVVYVSKVAAEWRKKFKKDVVIDLVSYRRNGHNEMDEPSLTQPIMYQCIAKQKTVLEQFKNKLLEEGVITEEYYQQEVKNYDEICENELLQAKSVTAVSNKDWLDSPWDGFFTGRDPMLAPSTGVEEDMLVQIGTKFSAVPADFNIHPTLKRTLLSRQDLLAKRQADWAMGEALAFGSLLCQGIHVRLSGQDVERGTFSQRHHVMHDQKIDKRTVNALNQLAADQAVYSVQNSSLSEYAVMGFELGYSLTNPHSLIMWEAQFGDFMNTAQCIIDQFLASGQTKWVRQSGLVLLLPHGYEGMGPEHSSCRLERFLQMSSDDMDLVPALDHNFHMQQLHDINWFVCNPSTPANYFHLLRRQVLLPFRKPLIVTTPKSLLRHPAARSSLDAMIPGTAFQRLIPEDGVALQNPSGVQKLIFCSGKIFYELLAERERLNLTKDIAIARVEQISPFPYDQIKQQLETFPFARICWAQEEHKNMGAWFYVQPRLAALLKKHFGQQRSDHEIMVAARPPSASAASGIKATHLMEARNLMNAAMSI